MNLMTRRSALLYGMGIGAATAARAWVKDFWIDKKSADWTGDEVQQILTKSPWAKDASIFDTAAHKGVSNAPLAGGIYRRGGGAAPPSGRNPIPAAGSTGKWSATVRWDSALPVRDALQSTALKGADENYIIALIGDIPGVSVPTDDDSAAERQQKLDTLKEFTRIERKDDPLELQQVKIAPRSPRSPGGTWFYFSRVFPIAAEDKQVTFVTRVGPLEVKCKFVLRDMVYQGRLEL
jgi:hypothetical protein